MPICSTTTSPITCSPASQSKARRRTTTIPWEGHAILSIKTHPAARPCHHNPSLARAFTFAKPEEYQDLRAFYQKVAAADQQQLVLTASPAAKGN